MKQKCLNIEVNFYEHEEETAMGIPLSPIIANLLGNSKWKLRMNCNIFQEYVYAEFDMKKSDSTILCHC